MGAVLPVYDRLREDNVSDELALLQVLLHLLAVNEDTNVLSRGGLAGLQYVREYATRLLEEGGVLATDGLEKMAAFDDELIARNLSPGGTADLLAVAAFLAKFPTAGAHNDHGRLGERTPVAAPTPILPRTFDIEHQQNNDQGD